jgi:DNA (cytosine-5)-methyltransferase 1
LTLSKLSLRELRVIRKLVLKRDLLKEKLARIEKRTRQLFPSTAERRPGALRLTRNSMNLVSHAPAESCSRVGQGAPRFIDLCAGCGGLSLGLGEAGWKGIFAIEKDGYAFKTLKHNLLDTRSSHYDWPTWLSKEAHSLEDLIENHSSELKKLRGSVDLISGGPPCQGFSHLGRRNANDPRNHIFRHYLKVVELTRPTMVLMENVRGILHPFDGSQTGDSPARSFGEIIVEELQQLGYATWQRIVYAKEFGVPQHRPRFILVGLLKERAERLPAELDPFEVLTSIRSLFLKRKNLPDRPVTIKEAISDLTRCKERMHPCAESPRFKQGSYGSQSSTFQALLHGEMNGAIADSHRFANHLESTVEKFAWFQANCSRGKRIPVEERGKYANKKHAVHILDPNSVGPTVTTLPDDYLHYSEPRILTVREMARLQSFPDWFAFKGKYTTGGDCRAKECPRYTQVGNAVPPLMAEALGITLLKVLDRLKAS